MRSAGEILVIGAGVVGLSTAHVLAERGYGVRVVARDRPPHTTSNQAGAFWYPFLTAAPANRDRALQWALHSLHRFCTYFADQPHTGVRQTPVVTAAIEPEDAWWWHQHVPGIRRARSDEGAELEGYAFHSVTIRPDHYLAHLVEQAEARGIGLETGELGTLEEATADATIVVNCGGLGARTLCGDSRVYPARGQIVRVAEAMTDATLVAPTGGASPTYAIPRQGDTVLGGTKQNGDWDTRPRQADVQAILSRCGRLVGGLGERDVLETRVGLRPCRDDVRLEIERVSDGRIVVHNYGHGGSGFTLSWGCAEEVGQIVDAIRGS